MPIGRQTPSTDQHVCPINQAGLADSYQHPQPFPTPSTLTRPEHHHARLVGRLATQAVPAKAPVHVPLRRPPHVHANVLDRVERPLQELQEVLEDERGEGRGLFGLGRRGAGGAEGICGLKSVNAGFGN